MVDTISKHNRVKLLPSTQSKPLIKIYTRERLTLTVLNVTVTYSKLNTRSLNNIFSFLCLFSFQICTPNNPHYSVKGNYQIFPQYITPNGFERFLRNLDNFSDGVSHFKFF